MPLIRKPSDASRDVLGDPFVLIASSSPDERWAAARALGSLTGGAAALSERLVLETDLRVRETIFTGLSRLATSESVEAVLPYLRSDDASLRTAALDAMRAMPLAMKPYLPNLLSDPDPDVRLLSCEIVRGLTAEEATPLLCAVLDREASANVCAAAVDVLAEIGGPEAGPALARCAARFPETFLAFAITIAAQRISEPARLARG